MNTFDWTASTNVDDIFPIFLERLEKQTGKKKICVFPNSFVKSTVFFEGVKRNTSFGLFQVFYLEELVFFLKMLFQKKRQKKLFTYQELVFYLEEFLEKMNIQLLEESAPLTLKRKLLPNLLEQFAKELYEAVCNPQKKVSKERKELVDMLLGDSIFLNPFEMEFDQTNEFEIHLFGFDTFELVTMELFFRLNQDIFVYSFYPTFELLQEKMQNPLLFSCTQFLKKQLSLLDHYQIDLNLHFCVPQNLTSYLSKHFWDFTRSKEVKETLLKRIQIDLISNQKTRLDLDDSVCVKAAKNDVREIEVFLEHVESFLTKHPEKSAKDILVLVQDLDTYVPIIQAVFQNPNIPFSFQILRQNTSSSFLNLFFDFLDLANSPFEKKQIFDLLYNPAIYKKHGLKSDDLERIEKKFKVSFGLNSQHREEHFHADGIKHVPIIEKFTFLSAYEQFLDALLDAKENLFDPMLDTFGKVIEFTQKLYLDFKPLREDERQPVFIWCDLLLQFLEFYFFIDFEDEDATRALEALQKTLCRFSQYEHNVSFSHFYNQLKTTLFKQQSFFREAKNGIYFAPLEMHSVVPKEMIAMIGLKMKAFSNVDTNERARHCFLKALLSSTTSFFASFSKEDDVEHPALFLKEFCTLYTIPIQDTLDFVFEKEQVVSNFFKEYVSTYPIKPKNPLSRDQKTPAIPTFKDLISIYAHPLRAYFQKQDIFFEKQTQSFDLFLSPFEKQQSLKEDVKNQSIINSNNLPVGFMEKVALFDLKETEFEIEQHLKRLDIHKEDLFSLELEMGVLYNLTKKGALIFSKQKSIAHIKALVTLLACGETISNTAYLIDLNKTKILRTENPKKHLEELMDFGAYLLEEPKPFFLEMIPAILKKDEEAIQKIIKQKFSNTFIDPYLLYFLKDEKQVDTKALIESLYEPIKTIFEPLFRQCKILKF